MLWASSLLHNQLWYLFPLLITVSLVYGATRHELLFPILEQAWKAGVWILTFMGSIFVVLAVLSWFT